MTALSPRLRRFPKWFGLLACTLVATAWALTLNNWGPGYCFGSGLHVGLGSGQATVFVESGMYSQQGWVSCFVNPDGQVVVKPVPLAIARSGVPAPQYGGDGVSLSLPVLLVLIALPTILLWHLDRRRHPPGHCADCGYNLTGNVSRVCPECGTSIVP